MLTEKIEKYCFPERISNMDIEHELSKFIWYLFDNEKSCYKYESIFNRQYAIVKDNEILLCFRVHEYHHNRYDNNYVYLIDNVGICCKTIPWEKLSEYDKWAKGEKLKKEKEAKEKEEQEKMEKFSKLQIIIISKLA